MTPEEWTNRIERSVFLYWESNYDQLLLEGLQRIRDSKEFAENLAHYTKQDPCGKARWEKLMQTATEIENRRNAVISGDWTWTPPTTQEGG
jgi:hypothetical protein